MIMMKPGKSVPLNKSITPPHPHPVNTSKCLLQSLSLGKNKDSASHFRLFLELYFVLTGITFLDTIRPRRFSCSDGDQINGVSEWYK